MSNYYISASIELQDGADLEEAENGLRHLVKQTRSEPGCILFEIRQNLKEPHKFTLWECWTSRQALLDHFEMPHTKAYLARNLTEVNYIEELGEIGANATSDAA
ncbi:MAG: antibiotic biosynthesis monooxygenase [Roseibium sp.]|uniref:putative quinol monooxygenase n=1 Tax=Roseibium sp. TaxID=1936156 RepID=UPI002627C880|nr:putative quinol monooxygenase [Roseibium sp.]MCV0428141.1 antibiotic biosynthesis monooxygenase [Roseibium sp.]